MDGMHDLGGRQGFGKVQRGGIAAHRGDARPRPRGPEGHNSSGDTVTSPSSRAAASDSRAVRPAIALTSSVTVRVSGPATRPR